MSACKCGGNQLPNVAHTPTGCFAVPPAHPGAERETDTPWRTQEGVRPETAEGGRFVDVIDAAGTIVLGFVTRAYAERIVAAVNAKALSDSALARLEQTWREQAAKLTASKRPNSVDVHTANVIERMCDELAALRARGETPRKGCINCGETNDGGYETEEVGPFCSSCWQHLEEAFGGPVVSR